MLQYKYPLTWGLSPFVVRGQPSNTPLRWSPDGLTATALDLPDEPVRTYSWYGVRGSNLFPFGKGFPDYLEFDGIENAKYPILGLIAIIGLVYLVCRA